MVATTGSNRWAAGLLLVLASSAALAVGPPPASYPERIDDPHDSAERDETCAAMRARVERSGASLREEGVLARWNFIRTRHRKAERYLKEFCGDATSHGLELSHAGAARQGLPDYHHPDRTLPATPGHDDHGGGGH